MGAALSHEYLVNTCPWDLDSGDRSGLAVWAGWWPGGMDGDGHLGRGWGHKRVCRTEMGEGLGWVPICGSGGPGPGETWVIRRVGGDPGREMSRLGCPMVAVAAIQGLHVPTQFLAPGARQLPPPPTVLRSC